MVDMSEILKRIRQRQMQEKKTLQSQPQMSVEPPKEKLSFELGPGDRKQETGVEPGTAPAVKIAQEKAEQDGNIQLYQSAVSLIKDMMSRELDLGSQKLKDILTCVKAFTGQLKAENIVLLELAASVSEREEDFAEHAVNVCIFCITIGLSLRYAEEMTEDLGACALVHTIGMKEQQEIFSPLTRRGFTGLNKKGDLIDLRMLEQLEQMCQEVTRVIPRQQANYLQGVKDDQSREFAKVVALACIYEAMIHCRAYRGEYITFQSLKTIIKDENALEKRLLKILIKAVGLYPVGSLVKLSTQEEARVIKINQGMPFRPVVEVTYDSYGNKLAVSRQLDLLQHPTTSIRKSLEGRHG